MRQSEFVSLGSILNELIPSSSEYRQRGIRSGIYDLDRNNSGLFGGQLTVVGGRKGCGKTSLALFIAGNVAIRQGKSVGVISLEGSRSELAIRVLAAESGVPRSLIASNEMGHDQRKALGRARRVLSDAPLYLKDIVYRLDVRQIISDATGEVKKGHLDLLIVDWVQLLRDFSQGYENRSEEFDGVVRSLKHLARDLGIPVIAVSRTQLINSSTPTAVESVGASALIEHADLVLLIHRAMPDIVQDSTESVAEITIAKNRFGGQMKFPIVFLQKTSTFRNLIAA